MNKITSTIKYSAVLHVTGWLLLLECVMLLIPIAVCLVYGEADWNVFAIASGSCLAPGLALVLPYRHRSFSVTRRESYLLTGLCWVLFSAFGMLPLMFASGVGANGNISVGVGTVGGLLFGTLALLFMVPVFFVIFQYIHERIMPKRTRGQVDIPSSNHGN